MTEVQQLVDRVLDEAQTRHPGVEFGLTLSLANALLLPKDANKLWREDSNGQTGYYSGHVYRDCLVTEIPNQEPAMIDFLVIASPVRGTGQASDRAKTYYGDLRTGDVGTDLPDDGAGS